MTDTMPEPSGKPDAIDWDELRRREKHRPCYEQREEPSDTAGKPCARVNEFPLDMYLGRKIITDRQYDAGNTLRCDYEDGQILSCMPYDGTPAPKTYGPRTWPARQIEAAGAYSSALDAIGKTTEEWLKRLCCHGQAADEIFQINRGNKVAMSRAYGRVQVALDILADHYRY